MRSWRANCQRRWGEGDEVEASDCANKTCEVGGQAIRGEWADRGEVSKPRIGKEHAKNKRHAKAEYAHAQAEGAIPFQLQKTTPNILRFRSDIKDA